MSDENENGAEEVSVDEMVEALYDVRDEIIKLAKLGQKINHVGLKRRTILVLLKDSTGVSMSKVDAVLKGIENLGDDFLKFPDAMAGRESLKRRAKKEAKK